MNTISNTLNSYEDVIREHGISVEKFHEVGIKLCLFASREAAMADWSRLKEKFLQKKKMLMRMVVHEYWLRRFYYDLFRLELVKDPDGNQAPNVALCRLLGIHFLGVNYGLGFHDVPGYVYSPREILTRLI